MARIEQSIEIHAPVKKVFDFIVSAWDGPMKRIIDDWGLSYPGVKRVEHFYFYGVPVVDDETRRNYLE